MNRKIVFRGKDLQTKEWRHGYLYRLKLPSGFANMILVGDDVEIEMDNSSSPRHHLSFTLEKDLYAVSSDTIGQFTGLHDKNGKEIYEGDIIESDRKIIHEIYYQEIDARFMVARDGNRKFLSGGVTQKWIDEFDNVVIGNIHDNPELIKV